MVKSLGVKYVILGHSENRVLGETNIKINKKVLSEIDIYSGKIKMPKGFEIDRSQLVKNITLTNYYEDVNLDYSKDYSEHETDIQRIFN